MEDGWVVGRKEGVTVGCFNQNEYPPCESGGKKCTFCVQEGGTPSEAPRRAPQTALGEASERPWRAAPQRGLGEASEGPSEEAPASWPDSGNFQASRNGVFLINSLYKKCTFWVQEGGEPFGALPRGGRRGSPEGHFFTMLRVRAQV